jgi:hypothetical protein
MKMKKMKMPKPILTMAGAALMALSAVQFAAASEHHGRVHHRAAIGAQFRNSNADATPPSVAVQQDWTGYYSRGYSALAGR